MSIVELRPERMVAGGAALARDADGRVVFVEGALPGEVVGALVQEVRRDFARAVTVDVRVPSPLRVEAPCPSRAAGCGGCPWQHVDPAAQLDLKTGVVRDALARLAHRGDVEVVARASVAPSGYRTTVRAAIAPDGRAGMRALGSHDVVVAEECLVAHPTVRAALRDVRVPGADEVTLRTSAAHGGLTALVEPPGVAVQGVPGVVTGPGAALDERVEDVELRVSAPSFFQSGPEAAGLLARTVGALAGDLDGATAVDAYGGVGLLAATALRGACHVELVEASRSACIDARANLRGRAARVVRTRLERWRPSPADVVVADPARSGLGREAARKVAATGAGRVVLVSCDPAALGRDTRLLEDHGYRLERVEVLDLFPHTHHVESVARFAR